MKISAACAVLVALLTEIVAQRPGVVSIIPFLKSSCHVVADVAPLAYRHCFPDVNNGEHVVEDQAAPAAILSRSGNSGIPRLVIPLLRSLLTLIFGV